MERVSRPQADPYRTGHRRSLESPANSSPKHPWLAARARVAWPASPLLLAERQTEGRNNKMRVPLVAPTQAGAKATDMVDDMAADMAIMWKEVMTWSHMNADMDSHVAAGA